MSEKAFTDPDAFPDDDPVRLEYPDVAAKMPGRRPWRASLLVNDYFGGGRPLSNAVEVADLDVMDDDFLGFTLPVGYEILNGSDLERGASVFVGLTPAQVEEVRANCSSGQPSGPPEGDLVFVGKQPPGPSTGSYYPR